MRSTKGKCKTDSATCLNGARNAESQNAGRAVSRRMASSRILHIVFRRCCMWHLTHVLALWRCLPGGYIGRSLGYVYRRRQYSEHEHVHRTRTWLSNKNMYIKHAYRTRKYLWNVSTTLQVRTDAGLSRKFDNACLSKVIIEQPTQAFL